MKLISNYINYVFASPIHNQISQAWEKAHELRFFYWPAELTAGLIKKLATTTVKAIKTAFHVWLWDLTVKLRLFEYHQWRRDSSYLNTLGRVQNSCLKLLPAWWIEHKYLRCLGVMSEDLSNKTTQRAFIIATRCCAASAKFAVELKWRPSSISRDANSTINIIYAWHWTART